MVKERIIRKGVAFLLSAAMALTSVGVMPYVANTKIVDAAETESYVTVKTLKGIAWNDAGNQSTECGKTFYVYGSGDNNDIAIDITDGTHYLSMNSQLDAWWFGVAEETAAPVVQGDQDKGVISGNLFKITVAKDASDFTVTYLNVTTGKELTVTGSSSEFSNNISVKVTAQFGEVMLIDSAEEISDVIPVTDGTVAISNGNKIKYGFKVKGNTGTDDLNIPVEINGKVVAKTVQANGENAWCEIIPKVSGSYTFAAKSIVQDKVVYAADAEKTIVILKNDTGITLGNVVDSPDPEFDAEVISTQTESFENSIDGKTVGNVISANASNATPNYVEGYSGKGVSFSGAGSDGIELNIKPTSKRYVLSFLMKVNASTQSTPAIFIANFDSSGVLKGTDENAQWISIATQGWQESLDAGPMVWSRNVPGGATWNDLIASTKSTLSLNKWHKIAVAADGAKASIYVDGVKVGNGPIADIIGEADTTTKMFLGVNAWDTPFNGIIDELKIINYDTEGTVTDIMPVPEVGEDDLVKPSEPTSPVEPEPTDDVTDPEPTDDVKPAGVTLNRQSLSMEIGDTYKLIATVTPDDTGVIWESSNESVATVGADGTITALKAGVATIKAISTDNANLSATCTVIVNAEIDTNLTDESQLGTSTNVAAYDRVSVHDPSIVVGYYEGTYSSSTKVYGVQNASKTRKEIYFVFGSHMAWAYSFDLKNWKTFTNNINKDYSTIFATDAEWSAHGSDKYDLSGNLWAPDIIWNPTMNKWCMYMSVNGDDWYTSVVLLTSDSLNGSWTRVGPVVYSGFTKSTDEWAKNQTDLFKVIGGSTIPDRYREMSNNGRALYGMNAIDPCIIYDDEGSLWMAYGSWFGGIYMLKLDTLTGLRDYTQTYATKENASDEYQGIKLAGGTNVSGEAPYIQKINGKYYLFLSYGGLTATGGYNMRVFSSDSITGPYKDLSGEDARYGDTNSDTTSTNAGNLDKTAGSQLMNYYRWGFMNTGFTAEGHNSAFVDDDGKAYVVYHTRFDDGTEGHQVRVHQLFKAKNNGLVAAPFEYAGEALSETAYNASKIAGEYNVILQKPTDYKNRECNTDEKVTLNADGTVTGAYTGTWVQANDGPYVTINLGSDTYEGVFLIQRMEETGNNAMCFTAVGNNDLAIWGYKVEDQTIAISDTIAQLNRLIPASTAVDIALPTKGVYGATISWKSNGIVMSDTGVVNPLKNDMDVVMTATITSGKYTFSKDYTIKVLGTDSVKTDTEVELGSYYTDTVLDVSKLSANNYVQLNNPFYNTLADISNGAIISFDVTRKGNAEDFLSNLLSLTGASGRLYFTGGSYLGYNGPGGFYDANVKNSEPWAAGTDLLTTDKSVNIKLKFMPDGFEVYKDGTLAYSKSDLESQAIQGGFNFAENGNWGTLSGSLMNWLKTGAPYLNLGYGNWWPIQIFNGTISNIKFSYVQKAINSSENDSSLVGIYTQDYEKVTDISKEWTSPSEAGQLKLSEDNEHGKFFLFDSPTGAGNRSAYNLFGTNVEWPDSYQIDFDLGLKSGNIANRSESQFAIALDTSFTANAIIANDKYIVSLNCPQQTSNSVTTTWQINGDANNTVIIPSADTIAGGWVHVTLKGNKTDGTGMLTIASETGTIYDKSITVPTGKAPTGFYVLNGRGSGLTKVDNIVVKEQGTDYANLSAYNNVLERAKKFVTMQGETPVFTDASFDALEAAIAEAERTVGAGLTSSEQNVVDEQVTKLTAAIDGLELKGYTVTIGIAENGTVEGLAAGGNYLAGTSLSLTAKPDSGYAFGGWKIGNDETIVSKNVVYSAMVTEDITITPVFVKAADLTEFNEVLASAEKIIAEQSASQVYTEETFSVLQQAVITARIAVPSTISEENQEVVAAQIEALKAAISGLKKIDSSDDTSPEEPDETPSPTPSVPDTSSEPEGPTETIIPEGLIAEYLFKGNLKDSKTPEKVAKIIAIDDDNKSEIVSDAKRGSVMEMRGTWQATGYLSLDKSYVNEIDNAFTVNMWAKANNSKSGDDGICGKDTSIFNFKVTDADYIEGKDAYVPGFVSLDVSLEPWINDYAVPNNYIDRTSNAIKLSTTDWQMVTMSIDGDNNKIYMYVDGKFKGEYTLGGGTCDALINSIKTKTTDIQIGTCLPWWNVWDFRGYVDDVRLYSKVLTAAEVTELYNMSGDESVIKVTSGGDDGNTGDNGGNTDGDNTGNNGGNTGGNNDGLADYPVSGGGSGTTPSTTAKPTGAPSVTPTVKPSVTATPDPTLGTPSPTPSGNGTGGSGDVTEPTSTPKVPNNGQSGADDDKNNVDKSDVKGYNKNRFDITSTKNKTIAYKKPAANSGSKVKIPATVKVTEKGKKVTYKVTSIKKNAFKGNKKVKQVTISKNIKTIGKDAFKNCSKMKKIKIKSKSIKKVGKGAFKGVSKNCVVEVPKSKKKAYTKMLRKAGLSKKVKIVGK